MISQTCENCVKAGKPCHLQMGNKAVACFECSSHSVKCSFSNLRKSRSASKAKSSERADDFEEEELEEDGGEARSSPLHASEYADLVVELQGTFTRMGEVASAVDRNTSAVAAMTNSGLSGLGETLELVEKQLALSTTAIQRQADYTLRAAEAQEKATAVQEKFVAVLSKLCRELVLARKHWEDMAEEADEEEDEEDEEEKADGPGPGIASGSGGVNKRKDDGSPRNKAKRTRSS